MDSSCLISLDSVVSHQLMVLPQFNLFQFYLADFPAHKLGSHSALLICFLSVSLVAFPPLSWKVFVLSCFRQQYVSGCSYCILTRSGHPDFYKDITMIPLLSANSKPIIYSSLPSLLVQWLFLQVQLVLLLFIIPDISLLAVASSLQRNIIIMLYPK